MHHEHIVIAERFRGPPRSGNGGYVCGLVARPLHGTVAVRLKAPPPLDRELRLASTEKHARLLDGNELLAEAKVVQLDLQPPARPSFEEAQVATRSFLGFRKHPFPGCFVCGVERPPLDGLRIFPGPTDTASQLAAPWMPDHTVVDESGKVKPEFLWAALDCPGAFVVMPLLQGLTVVLGELCASIVGDVRAQERCVVTAWPLGGEGRKRLAGSAVYGDDGRLVAIARAVWIEVPASSWG